MRGVWFLLALMLMSVLLWFAVAGADEVLQPEMISKPGGNAAQGVAPRDAGVRDAELRSRPDASRERRQDLVAESPATDTSSSIARAPFVVRVRVVDEEAVPVAGAKIWKTKPGRIRQGEIVGETDAEGELTIRSASATLFLGAFAAGYGPADVQAVTLVQGTTKRVSLRLLTGAGAQLQGQLVDTFDQAVVGEVFVTSQAVGMLARSEDGNMAPTQMGLRVRTDVHGRFSLAGWRPGGCKVYARAPGYAPASREIVLLAGENPTVLIGLGRGGVLRGRILDEAGSPIAGATVRHWRGPSNFAGTVSLSDDAGAFQLSALFGRAVGISASAEGFLDEHLFVDLEHGGQVVRDIVLRPGASFHGLVVERGSRKPVSGLAVEARPKPGLHGGSAIRRGKTRLDGTFLLRGCVPNYPYTLRVSRSGAEGWQLCGERTDVRAGGRVFEIEVDAVGRGAIFGTVVDAKDKPVPGARVIGYGVGAVAQARTDNRGRFRLSELTAGRYQLQLQSGVHPWLTLRDIELRDRAVDLGRVSLSPGWRLVGWIRAGNEIEVKALEARVVSESGEEVAAVRFAESHGRLEYRTGSLVPGAYRMQLSGKGIAVRSVPFRIFRGQDTVQTLTVEAGMRRRLTFEPGPDATGLAAFAHFGIRGEDGRLPGRSVAGLNGEFAAEVWLVPGRYSATVWAGGDNWSMVDFTVLAEDRRFQVVLPPRPSQGKQGGEGRKREKRR